MEATPEAKRAINVRAMNSWSAKVDVELAEPAVPIVSIGW